MVSYELKRLEELEKILEKLDKLICSDEENIVKFECADYIVFKNGIKVYMSDWNGEVWRGYVKDKKYIKQEVKPIYRFMVDKIEMKNLPENSEKWNYESEIVALIFN